MMKPTFRTHYLYAASLCGVSLSIALILQYYFYLAPCPLCILARVVFLALALVYLVGYWHNPKQLGRYSYGFITLLLSILGLLITLRHVWILHLPPGEVPDCSPGLSYLLKTLPAKEVIYTMLHSSGECADLQGIFLGLSLPFWTAVIFFVLMLQQLFLLSKKRVAWLP